MTTLVFGVVISGVVGSYVPHGIRAHTDVNQSIAASVGDVMAYDGAEWEPTAPSALPSVATHTHATYLPVATAATTYAPIITPDFTTSIEITAAAPKIVFHDDVGAVEDSNLNYDAGAFTLRSRARNIFKWESYYSNYNFASMGLKFSTITTSATIGNPTCVSYVDATAGNIALTLNAAADYYRNDTYYSSALLIIKRTDATANTVIITPNGAETINGAATLSLNGQNSVVFMQAIVGGWQVLYNYISGGTLTDSGWVNLTLNSPWTVVGTLHPDAATPTYAVPGYRKIGSQVFLRGVVNSGGSGPVNLIATLPTGYRPQADYAFPSFYATGSTSTTAIVVLVKTDGSIGTYTPTIGTSRTYHLHGFTFPVA